MTRADIERAVADLFTVTYPRLDRKNPTKAVRLALVPDLEAEQKLVNQMAGWGEQPMVDRLCRSLNIERSEPCPK